MPIACDDMLVLEGTQVFAGPRSLDLRGDASRRLGVGEPLGKIGDRERWRLELDPIGELPPLRGLFFLDWGDEVGSERLTPTARFEGVATNRGVNLLPPDPGTVLRLAALPAYRVARPRGWGALAATADELRRLAGA